MEVYGFVYIYICMLADVHVVWITLLEFIWLKLKTYWLKMAENNSLVSAVMNYFNATKSIRETKVKANFSLFGDHSSACIFNPDYRVF